MSDAGTRPLLHVVVCAAGVAGDVDVLLSAAQERGWDVGVVATPSGLGFLDVAAVEERTGEPVRWAWRRPDEPRPTRRPDAIAVAPATFNTVNKWAAGIADTLALGVLCEAGGLGVPVAVLPCVNTALAAHPAWAASLATLRKMGVRLGSQAPHEPSTPGVAANFPWTEALDLLGEPRFLSR